MYGISYKIIYYKQYYEDILPIKGERPVYANDPPTFHQNGIEYQLGITSDLMLQTGDNRDCLMEDSQFGLRFIGLQMQSAHFPQLFERLVQIANSQSVCRGMRIEERDGDN